MSTLLAGCTIPGLPDPQQVVDQTRMLTEMQQQMGVLLSGMDTLRQENSQMSGVIAQIYANQQANTTTSSPDKSHGSASLFGPNGEIIPPLSGSELTGLEIPLVESITGAMTGHIEIPAIDTGSIASWSIESWTTMPEIAIPEVNTGVISTGIIDRGVINTGTSGVSTGKVSDATLLLNEIKKANSWSKVRAPQPPRVPEPVPSRTMNKY